MLRNVIWMRWLAVCLLAVSSSHVFAFEYSELPSKLELKVGEVVVFEVPSIEKVAIGNSKTFSYKILDNDQLLIIAEQPGESTIHIWQHHKREIATQVIVRQEYMSKELSFAKTLAKTIDGLSVEEIDEKIVFTGKISQKDAESFQTLSQVFPLAIPMVKVREFDYEKMVRLDVTIVEINTSDREKLGIRWDNVIGGPAVGIAKKWRANSNFAIYPPTAGDVAADILGSIDLNDKSFYMYSGISTGISSQIDLMAETGNASILATPKLIAKNGEEAQFHAGGEFPFQVVGATGTPEVQFKPYGIIVKIEPFVDEKNQIKTLVEAEISNLDPSVQVGGNPGLLKRNVASVVNVLDGQTIVVSGLVAANMSKQKQKVPLLGDIPDRKSVV